MARPFKSEFATPAVFAVMEHMPFPNKKTGRCALTGATISKDDLVYMVKFKTYNDAERYYVSEKSARQDPGFRDSLSYHAQWRYPAALMVYGDASDLHSWGRTGLVDPEFAHARYESWQRRDWLAQAVSSTARMEHWTQRLGISPEAVRAELAAPLALPCEKLSDDAIWARLWESILHLEDAPPLERHDDRDPWDLLGMAVTCDLHPRLVERYSALSTELRVVLACSDNPVFVRLAMESALLPCWDVVRSIVTKARLSLDDMLALAAWGNDHPAALELIYRAHTMLGILSFSGGGPLGFRLLENSHGARLIYLFVGRPDLCPMLGRFDPSDPDVMGADYGGDTSHRFVAMWPYQLPYIFRAKVFQALTAGDLVAALATVAQMRVHVRYYVHGSPAGFINETAKLAEQYAKRYRMESR
jgi:hypothetical protein